MLDGNKLEHSVALLADVIPGGVQGLFECCQINLHTLGIDLDQVTQGFNSRQSEGVATIDWLGRL